MNPNSNPHLNAKPSFLARARNNILLQALEPMLTKAQWGARLRHEPLKDEKPHIKNREDAEACLHLIAQTFVPTRRACSIAEQVQRLIRNGLVGRDERDLPLDANGKTLSGDPNRAWNPVTVSGMVLKSMTRQGKTHLINRITHYFPQVIAHVDPWPGQRSLKQLVHLIVPMPSNASKKGFIYATMMEMDKVLGTSYAERFDGRVSAEVELVKLLNLLKAHKCGMLIVEECQVQNELGAKAFGADFATFFLSVLNSGIPTLIIGNTKAFRAIEKNSQIMCRLSEGGLFDLHPAGDWLAEDWAEEFMPNLWAATVFDLPDEEVEDLNEVIWRATGGFCHFLGRLRADTLRFALDAGADHVRAVDIAKAIQKMRESGDWPLIRAFVEKNELLLSKFEDIPHDYYSGLWKSEREAARTAQQALAGSEEVTKQKAAASPAETGGATGTRPSTRKAPAIKKVAKKPSAVDGEFDPADLRSQAFRRALGNASAAEQ